MKKNLIAVAVAAALAAPAVALADTTLYGQAHLSLDATDDGIDSGLHLQSNSSRLGIKGSEDLGNGLTVLFQLEGAVNFDGSGAEGGGTNQTRFGATRTTFLGLATANAGTFLAGKLPAGEQWLYDANLFGDQVGDTGNLIATLPGRADNALHWVAPSMNGFGLALTYVPEGIGGSESPIPGATEDVWGAKLSYGNGPLFLGLTYFNIADAGLPGQSEWTNTAVTGTYDFGAAKVVGVWATDDNLGTTNGLDRDTWSVGLAVPVGSGTAKAHYVVADDLSGTNNTGASMWAIGYDYPLSKRTTAYVAYASTDNDNAAGYSVDNYGHSAVTGGMEGEDPNSLSVGLVHNF